ncbi:MAG: DUF349 domain-containing protein [Flavobacteriales bacterium]
MTNTEEENKGIDIEQQEEKIIDNFSPKKDFNTYSTDDLVSELKRLNESDDFNSTNKAVEEIKAVFYKKLNKEKQTKKNDFLENGGKEEEFEFSYPLEKTFKNLYNIYRKKKAQYREQLEANFSKSLNIKQNIIQDIKNLVESEETLKETFDQFKNLQEKWRSTGEVSIGYRNDIWNSYHHQVERFYDFIKINKDLRDLDFNKNYQLKISLCEQAEQLTNEKSIHKIHSTLQDLHEKWKNTGPVKREFREEIWGRFKAATRQLHKKRNDHYTALKQKSKEALKNKLDFCLQIDQITDTGASNHNMWKIATEKVISLENEWKKVGFLNKEDNKLAWKTLRESLTRFHHKKNDFYKIKKSETKSVLTAKISLCEKVEQLNSTPCNDWKLRSNEFFKIQEDWKKSGYLPKSQSEKIWKRFKNSLDEFYNSKKLHFEALDLQKVENLDEKKKLLKSVKALKLSENKDENLQLINRLTNDWNSIGRVPRDESDIENEFRKLIDSYFSEMKVSKQELNDIHFNNKLLKLKEEPNSRRIEKEKQILKNKINDLQKEINQYETNISFFGNSKGADKIKEQVLSKIQESQFNIKSLKHKLKLINAI